MTEGPDTDLQRIADALEEIAAKTPPRPSGINEISVLSGREPEHIREVLDRLERRAQSDRYLGVSKASAFAAFLAAAASVATLLVTAIH